MNYYYPHNQMNFIFSMLITGIFIGVLYDVFKIKRKLIGDNFVILFVDDVAYSLLSLFVYVVSVFIFNSGIIRWYSALVCIVGFFIYKYTLSVPITYLMYFVIDILHKAVFVVFKIVTFPIILIFNKPYNLICRYLIRLKKYHSIKI